MSFPILNAVAEREVEKAIRYYLSEAGQEVASGFYAAFLKAGRHIAAFPRSGSSRYGEILNVPHLKSWRIQKYPYVLFYVVGDSHIEIVHLLHLHSDIPVHLKESDQD